MTSKYGKGVKAIRVWSSDVGNQQGHPMTDYSKIRWKHFLGSDPEYFRSLEMHSKRRYKIFISSVIPGPGGGGGIYIFSKLQGLQYYFSENVRCNLTCYEREVFLIPFSITF